MPVNGNGSKLDDENPEVVQPQAFILVFGRDPAPACCAREELFFVHQWADKSQDQSRQPDAEDGHDEPYVWHLVSFDHTKPRVYCNCEDEKATRNIPYVEEPTLDEARYCWSKDLANPKPVKGYREGDGLLKICEKQVVDEDDILVVADILPVVSPPADKSVCDEAE